MQELVSDELKQSSIGQAIIKAIKTRCYIPPLLFGLGIELDHKSKKGLQPERLPPTENAIKYHSYRVHLQVLKWMGVDLDELKLGWRKENEILVPVKWSLKQATEYKTVLKLILW